MKLGRTPSLKTYDFRRKIVKLGRTPSVRGDYPCPPPPHGPPPYGPPPHGHPLSMSAAGTKRLPNWVTYSDVRGPCHYFKSNRFDAKIACMACRGHVTISNSIIFDDNLAFPTCRSHVTISKSIIFNYNVAIDRKLTFPQSKNYETGVGTVELVQI